LSIVRYMLPVMALILILVAVGLENIYHRRTVRQPNTSDASSPV
jgi:hypothetical protein